MLKSQQELNFSQYTDLYDKLIPQNHLFRKINELIDFSFIREELMVKGRKIKICKKLACKVSNGKTFFSASCIAFKINFIRIDYTKQKFKTAGIFYNPAQKLL